MKNIACIQERTTATATIVDALRNPNNENEIVVIWVIDSGPHRTHKIFDRFFKTTVGRRRFKKMLEGINYHSDIMDGEDFQVLVGKRAEIVVEYTFSELRKAWINIIGSYTITDKKPDYDPLRPQKEDRFYHTYNPRKLPIKKTL